MQDKNYKLLYRRRGSLNNFLLYAGDDHFLLVNNVGYSEEYNRVFYSDITAVTMGVKRKNFWLIALCAFIFVICIGIAFLLEDAALNFLWGIFSAVSGTLTLYFAFRSGMGIVTIKNHIEDVNFRMVARKSKKLFPRMSQCIKDVQGEFDQQSIIESSDAFITGSLK